MKTKLIVGLAVFLISGVTYATCPDSLDAKSMNDCVSMEQAGGNYQDEMMKAESDGMVSPITGTDVRTIEPAAGGADGSTDETADTKAE